MVQKTERIKNFIEKIDIFLENYEDGKELQMYISPGEKDILENYIQNHPKGGQEFHLMVGILKSGHLKHDYILRKFWNRNIWSITLNFTKNLIWLGGDLHKAPPL